jgi:hypothetical protein
MKKSANGKAFVDGLKSLLKGIFKILSILLSWAFKMVGVIGEKMGEFFSKLGTK